MKRMKHYAPKKIKLSQLGFGDVFIKKPLQIPYRGIKYLFCQSGKIQGFSDVYFLYKSFNLQKSYCSLEDLQVTLIGYVDLPM